MSFDSPSDSITCPFAMWSGEKFPLSFNLHLKRELMSNEIEKVMYFSDGAGSQYKKN